MASWKSSLERENHVVLTAVQAFLGLIAPTVIAIGVTASTPEIIFDIWVTEDSPDVREDIDDALFEFEAQFTEENPPLRPAVHQGPPPPDQVLNGCRMIFWAKSAATGVDGASEED